jgi:hypothetical protein
MEVNFHDFGLGQNSFGMSPTTSEKKLINENFLLQKLPLIVKRKATEGHVIFVNHISDKGLLRRKLKEVL